jgi:hypothetical protein
MDIMQPIFKFCFMKFIAINIELFPHSVLTVLFHVF